MSSVHLPPYGTRWFTGAVDTMSVYPYIAHTQEGDEQLSCERRAGMLSGASYSLEVPDCVEEKRLGRHA